MVPLLLAIGIAAAPAQQARTVQPIEPGSWVTADDYPPVAIRQGEQGIVGYQLAVTATGAVAKCTVTSSSGSEALDATTCALLTRRARFVPARDAHGKPIASTVRSRFNWTLP